MAKTLEEINQVIEALRKAKELLKDEMDDKIKAKMQAEMKRSNFGEADATRHVIDRDRGDKMPKIKKPKQQLLQSELELQKAKTEAMRELLKSDNHKEPVKKTVDDIADDLIKSLESMDKIDGAAVTSRPNVNHATGWTQDPATGGFHHKIHGVISTLKEPDGQYSVRHSGKTLGTYPTIPAAGAKIKEHIDWLGSFKSGAGMNRYAKTVKSEDMDKSANAAKIAEQTVMNHLAKTVGAMMPQAPRQLQPTQEQFEAAMVAQGMAVTQEQADQMQKSWDGKMTDWFSEALKPISARFNSPEEEEAYWTNIRVTDSGNGPTGY